MTLTLNPLMGNLSSTYAVQASPALALCSRFDFNVYSYESDFWVGMELWRARRTTTKTEEERGDGVEWARSMLRIRAWEGDALFSSEVVVTPTIESSSSSIPSPPPNDNNDPAGVLKARITQDMSITFRWEIRA